MTDSETLNRALQAIDCGGYDYSRWLGVSAGYKAEGGDYGTWSSWCRAHANCKPEEVTRAKWDALPTGGGTGGFWQAAKEGGVVVFSSGAGHRLAGAKTAQETRQTRPTQTAQARTRGEGENRAVWHARTPFDIAAAWGGGEADPGTLTAASPQAFHGGGLGQLHDFLTALGGLVGFGAWYYQGDVDTRGGIIEPLEAWITDARAALAAGRSDVTTPYMVINPLAGEGRKDSDVTAPRFCLFECDEYPAGHPQAGQVMPKAVQVALIRCLMGCGFTVRAVVDSGGKSLHAWLDTDGVTAADWPDTVKARFYGLAKLIGADPKNSNPARLTRCPGHIRTVYRDAPDHEPTPQTLLYLDMVTPPKMPFADAVARLEKRLSGTTEDDSGAVIMECLFADIKQGRYKTSLPTGFATVDKYLDGGLMEGLTILGAVTSLGKTTWAMQAADYMAANGFYPIVISCEMAAWELVAKSLSRITGELGEPTRAPGEAGSDIRCQTLNSILRGSYRGNAESLEAVKTAATRYMSFARNITIKEAQGRPTPRDIREYLEKYLEEHPDRRGRVCMVIDYLQIMGSDISQRGDNREKIDDTVIKIKQLTRDYQTPCLLISSFNRQANSGSTDMTNFKESGCIEYSADTLLALQLEGQGKTEFDQIAAKAQNPRKVELLLLKNRRGQVFKDCGIQFNYYPAYNLYIDVAQATGKDDMKERLEVAKREAKQRRAKAASDRARRDARNHAIDEKLGLVLPKGKTKLEWDEPIPPFTGDAADIV